MGIPHKRFFWILVACFGATLLPIFILNLTLLNSTLGNRQKVLAASQWQQRTHGITYAPTLGDTHLFKTLRLNDRLPEINTVVFGSSTAMGLTQQAFPGALRIYNYAQTGHPLSAAIGEAEYVQQHAARVKWLVIPLDWSIGFIYQHAVPSAADLSAATAMQQVRSAAEPVPLLERMRDALSYPRVANLLEISKTILRAENRPAAFRGYFLQEGSDDYRCADGTPGKDFDTIHRGTCTGFRFDGSATFADSARVGNARSLILSATTSSSKYHQNLALTEGVPDPLLLQRLAALGERARQNGGGVMLFMPPLLPGMEAEFLHHPQLAARLRNTKRKLAEWARAQHLAILDAGQAERFGCGTEEFIDEHHAVATCYDKIFQPFWRDALRPDGTITLPDGGLR
ncbi:MAG: hypothetical protein EPN14_08940 [Gallionella sp.]|nr:MAG: hypothetical protein EPN14_08940 [Gallionella sp.]